MAIRFQKYKFLLLLLFVVCGCNQSSETFSNKEINIEKKIDSVLGLMTLEEKIGQMSQVRHFSDISENDVATKFIGSIIHTQGQVPGDTAKEWQQKFSKITKKGAFYTFSNSFIIWCRCNSWSKYI